ncbi:MULTISPECIES: TetR/AcrR family transcriptional regulator [Rhodococcus]|uniref:TetR family transcriptional regulator n=1 Tax=Rhodococcus erythropolis TaxID=1833 RepID=A0A8I1A0Y2_RHOER|nr:MULTISPECIES: TetR/AcrR family transcriptional regulator [Rhodococcus]MBH5146933.1 TetR family transcriptional regulator [Rhodococcus erythropolis]MBY6387108.1 TetR family transcriptional regulator [Rhodococcus erythropolis]
MSTQAAGSHDRRELIANSAIRVIARDGVRALTHRVVDIEAGIPQGATSHHARTRLALIELIVNTLAERAIADAKQAAAFLNATAQGEHQLSISDLAGVITALVETLSDRRDDMKARYALVLELGDEPLLRRKLTTQSEVHAISREVTAILFDRAGLPSSDERVDELITLTDALVFHRTIIQENTSPESILAAYLRGVASLAGDLIGES